MTPDTRRRLTVVLALLAAHGALYAAFSLPAMRPHVSFDPLEPFNLLLLGANAVIAALIVTQRRDLLIGGAVMFLVGAHAFLGFRVAPDPLTSGAILLVNILVVYVGVKLTVHLPARYFAAFVASYFALFGIFILAMDNAEALFLLFLMGLAATARSFRLLAAFWAITLSLTLGQPYHWEAMLVSLFILWACFGARGRAAQPTALVFLAVGLVVVFLVLLPVVVMLMREDPRNVLAMLRDARVRGALVMTLITATVSTGFLVLFMVPLAYGISRLRFPGRTLLLSLIDVPIVVPQSVAGIAILSVFGRQQFLGETLWTVFGVRIDGTMLGICVAQVFVAMPFVTKASLAAFDNVSPGLELAARTLGASSLGAFFRVSLPLAARGVFLGAVLTWARAAGEFGAVIFVAPTPETAPVAAYNRFQSVGIFETAPLIATLLLFSLAMFLLLQLVSRTLPGAEHRHGEVAP